RDRIDGFVGGVHKLERQAMLNARREPLLSPEWFDAMGAAVDRLRDTLPEGAEDPAALLERLRAVIVTAERQIETNMALFEELARLGEDSGRFQHALADMARLEERMRGVIDTGAALVARLQPGVAAGAGRG
ncbi:MAG: histidine kinase, partial [Alphaproteobacteria bacterium HGW-Alphaproteobacteria-8]